MKDKNGYWNKALRVDLSEMKCLEENISDSLLKELIGGSGIGTKVLYDEIGPDVKPFDEENRLIFALGPMQATNITGSAKFSVISRSPLTNIYADSSAGGNWGIELKKAGFDLLIIQGKANKPVYLWINNAQIEIRDASFVWGMDSYDSIDQIKKELGNKTISIATIGKGGENLIAIACIVFDKHSFAGRCGLGAVMGSKNLKAIAVKGTRKTPVANPERIRKLVKDLGKRVYENANKSGFRLHGTASAVLPLTKMGDVPIKYWMGDLWDGAEKISAPNYTEVLNARPWPCAYCVLGCHRYITLSEPTKYACEGAGAEYETLGLMGNACLIDDVKALAKANDICNRYGLDTISAGSWVAFLMECYEKGLITSQDTHGMEIKWGDADILIELIKQFGENKGIGSIFKEGIIKAAKEIGREAEEIAVHVKGLDLPAHDPRAFFSNYINYATGNRGGCHERGDPQKAFDTLLLPEFGIDKHPDRFTLEGKASLTIAFQDYSALANSLTICKYMFLCGVTLTDMLEVFNATTGWGFSMGDMKIVGERINAFQRLINNRYFGVSRKDDKIPKRLYQAAKEGSRAGKASTFHEVELAIDEYYSLRGWDKKGNLKKEKLILLENLL